MSPSPETLVVFYLTEAAWLDLHHSCERAGTPIARAHNPYLDSNNVTIEDADGYRVVLHRCEWRA